MYATAIEANRAAVSSRAKQVREQLLRLGMRRCSLTLVYRQCDPEALRPSWYCLFLRWFEALWLAHREGAELVFEHFLSFVAALRDPCEARPGDVLGALAHALEEAEREHSDIVRARFRGDDLRRLSEEIAEDIAAKRRLLATVMRLRAEERNRPGRRAA